MIQSSFGARSTASEVVAGHDLSGKTILITGASSGIGYEAVRALLSAHAEVIIAARDQVKGEEAIQALQTAYPGGQVHFLPLDLGLLASVRQTVEHFFAQMIFSISTVPTTSGKPMLNPKQPMLCWRLL